MALPVAHRSALAARGARGYPLAPRPLRQPCARPTRRHAQSGRDPEQRPDSSSSSSSSTSSGSGSTTSSSSSSSDTSSRANASGSSSPNTSVALAPAIFGSLEQVLARSFQLPARAGERDDWQELEGCYVLRPPAGAAPEAVVHFLGGAFVGAAPQLAYRQLLEALAARGVLVITTPFATSFDQMRIADEVKYKFDRCCNALAAELGALPVFGVGHSMGSLIHMLICARYAVRRNGNCLMSWNNRPATDSIPFLSPFLAPSARALGPLLSQLATSPFRAQLENVTDALRGLSPGLVRQLLPIVEQLTPIYLDVSQGRQEFTPSPQETATMLRNYYAVQRNLLLRFRDDSIDDSIQLAQLLQNSAAISSQLDLDLRTLDGDHVTPLAQFGLGDLPPEVASVANQAAAAGSNVLGRLADMASQMGMSQASGPLGDLTKGVQQIGSMLEAQSGKPAESITDLADEITAWVGVSGVVAPRRQRRMLPASTA